MTTLGEDCFGGNINWERIWSGNWTFWLQYHKQVRAKSFRHNVVYPSWLRLLPFLPWYPPVSPVMPNRVGFDLVKRYKLVLSDAEIRPFFFFKQRKLNLTEIYNWSRKILKQKLVRQKGGFDEFSASFLTWSPNKGNPSLKVIPPMPCALSKKKNASKPAKQPYNKWLSCIIINWKHLFSTWNVWHGEEQTQDSCKKGQLQEGTVAQPLMTNT